MATVAVSALLPRFPDLGPTGAHAVQVADYPRKKIGTVSSLIADEPQQFSYPYDHPLGISYLLKLDVPAGGGVGPDGDIVAFNTFCTHMGGSLLTQYKEEHKVLGPCPVHLSTFDLTRHGMVVAGHAIGGLPQVILEVEGDDIFATGVMSLIYGFSDNRVQPGS